MTSCRTLLIITITVATIASTLISLSCASRYRLDLYMEMEDQRQRVDVESTQYIMDAELGNILAETKVRPGNGNIVIATTGTRWPEGGKAGLSIIGYDEYLRSRLYLALPPMPQPDSFALEGNSFVTILGRYDWPVEDKGFLPREGYFVIDSIASGHLFMTVSGVFRNRQGLDMSYNGQFKVKADVGG